MRTQNRFLIVAAIVGAVGQSAVLRSATPQSAIRNPPSAIRNGAWKTLFDGKSLDAWRGYKTQTMPAGWRIEAGALVKDDRVPDIITKDQYGDFELELEWKIGEAGNSGIFYRGIEDPDYKGTANNDRIYTTGPEYQLLDDIKAADNKTRLTCAAAAYGLYPSPEGHLKPVGQWNKTRIVANGAHVEHWLNDVKVVEYELWSPDWEAKVQAAKFKDWPKFGRAKRGHIGLQGDHEGPLAFRNIRIRDLS
jgi:3-keto-disaccharide hydrolase